MALTDPSKGSRRSSRYMFAELERKIEQKAEEGIEVISLGIGDPDTPTFRYVVEAMREAVGDPAHQVPVEPRSAGVPRGVRGFLPAALRRRDRPGRGGDPGDRRHECIYNLCFAFLDPGDVALASDPGYPVYTAWPVLAGAEACLLPLLPRLEFTPDLDAVPSEKLRRSPDVHQLPQQPDRAVVPDGFFERVVELAREHEFLVVHDNAYSETTFDGYVAPSFLATPGAKEVGVEVFSLSKGYNMTGWRCAAILGNAEAVKTYYGQDERRFRAVRGGPARRGGRAAGPRKHVEEMCAIYQRRRDPVVEALGAIGVTSRRPRAPSTSGPRSSRATHRPRSPRCWRRRPVISPGSMWPAERGGLLPDLADDTGRAG